MKPTYQNYLDFHASKCGICKGSKRIQIDSKTGSNIWTACGCQYNATVKWRYDQITIYPESLKFKGWDDFIGINEKGGKLTEKSFVSAKKKALRYCFGSESVSVLKERSAKSIVLRHVGNGDNVVICGDTGTGRSLLAALILKEIVYASAVKNTNVDFRWVKATELMDAARWDSQSKSINRDLLDNWSECHFLFIDGVDLKPESGDHRAPPDMTSLNLLFGDRLKYGLPTIVVCSDKVMKAVVRPGLCELVKDQYGIEFYTLLTSEKNVIIDLYKEVKVV